MTHQALKDVLCQTQPTMGLHRFGLRIAKQRGELIFARSATKGACLRVKPGV